MRAAAPQSGPSPHAPAISVTRTIVVPLQLASLATFYPKKHYATWIDPRSSNGHMNDHILISRVDLARFSDCGSCPCMLFESDHHLVGCKLRVTELGAGEAAEV